MDKLAAIALRIVLGFSVVSAAPAQAAPTPPAGGHAKIWKEKHPRRAQVSNRLDNQNARIKAKRKSGEITAKQAAKLHREDKSLRKEHRAMALRNGGHITKKKQKTLNQQENAISKQIGK